MDQYYPHTTMPTQPTASTTPTAAIPEAAPQTASGAGMNARSNTILMIQSVSVLVLALLAMVVWL